MNARDHIAALNDLIERYVSNADYFCGADGDEWEETMAARKALAALATLVGAEVPDKQTTWDFDPELYLGGV